MANWLLVLARHIAYHLHNNFLDLTYNTLQFLIYHDSGHPVWGTLFWRHERSRSLNH